MAGETYWQYTDNDAGSELGLMRPTYRQRIGRKDSRRVWAAGIYRKDRGGYYRPRSGLRPGVEYITPISLINIYETAQMQNINLDGPNQS